MTILNSGRGCPDYLQKREKLRLNKIAVDHLKIFYIYQNPQTKINRMMRNQKIILIAIVIDVICIRKTNYYQ